MSIESVMPANHLILYHPLLFLPAIFSIIRVFANESALRMRWPKYWSLSFNMSPSNEHPGLISFRKDWLDLLAVQEMKDILKIYNPCPHLKWAQVTKSRLRHMGKRWEPRHAQGKDVTKLIPRCGSGDRLRVQRREGGLESPRKSP